MLRRSGDLVGVEEAVVQQVATLLARCTVVMHPLLLLLRVLLPMVVWLLLLLLGNPTSILRESVGQRREMTRVEDVSCCCRSG